MKKAISLLLALVMLCMAFPTSVFALNEYVVYSGVEGCQLTGSISLEQEDNAWLLYDITFSQSDRVYTSNEEHPNLVGCKAVLSFSYEGDTLMFNDKTFAYGDTVTLKETNDLVILDNNGNRAEYTVIIKEKTNGLPVVLIDTVEDVKPADMTKLDYDDAYISVIGSDLCGGKDIYSAVAGIKLRGNSTMSYAKKPFRIKFDKKQDVLGMGKAKSWVLLADYLDPSAMRNAVAYDLADRIYKYTAATTGKYEVFSPRMEFVEVYFDGEFLGLYEMGDHMQANELRVAINELGDEEDDDGNNLDYAGEQIGYFIEFEVKDRVLKEGADGYEDWSAFSYITDVGSTPYKDTGKYAQYIKESDLSKSPLLDPDDVGKNVLFFQYKLPEKPTTQQKNYITDYMQNVNDMILNNEDVWDLVDIDSVVNWYLVNELFKNADSQMQSSVYFYKDGTLDEDGNPKANPDTKLYMAPVWDFDLGAGGVSYGEMNDPTEWRTRNDEYCGWFRELFETATFRNAVEKRWEDLRDENILGQLFSDIDTYGNMLRNAAEVNYEMWHESHIDEITGTWLTVPNVSETGDWSAQVMYLSRWLYTRIAWIDGEFGYEGATNTPNATKSQKDYSEMFKDEEVVAMTNGTSECTYPIAQTLDREHMAMNIDVSSDCDFNVTLNIEFKYKDKNGTTHTGTAHPNFSGDWYPRFPGNDSTKQIYAGTYNDIELNINGSLEYRLMALGVITQDEYNSISSEENCGKYITSITLKNVVIKQVNASVGDATTLSLTTYPQSYSKLSAVTKTVQKTVLGGKPIIAGEAKVGNTLTLTDLGITPFNAAVRYQWYVNNAAVQGETGKTYTIRNTDFGKNITVKAFGLFDYVGNVESDPVTVTGDGNAPAKPSKPTMTSVTTNTVTVKTVNGQMYTIDGGETWMMGTGSALTFSGLKSGNVYLVRTYIPATAASPASAYSDALTVTTTVKGTLKGDTNTDGKLTTRDAVLALEHSLGFITLKNETVLDLADITEDDKITTSDARHILKAIVETAG